MNTLIEIRKGLDLLFQPGDVVEVRVPRKHDDRFSSTIAGFFNDLDRLAEAIDYINTTKKQTVYVTMNPVKVSWQAVNNQAYVGGTTLKHELEAAGESLEPRMKKMVSWETGKAHYTMRMVEDQDILTRRWILIDIDAGQPAGTNSSDAEHEDTLTMAMKIQRFLKSRGFPDLGLTNSGNGHHLYLRVDLPNDVESMILVRRFLLAVSSRFRGQSGTAMVDEGMFNAGRITKAAGTFVYKGVPTEERPNRQSEVKFFASPIPVLKDLIVEIANEYTPKGDELTSPLSSEVLRNEDVHEKVDNLKKFLDYYEVQYGEIRQSAEDVIIPCTCPNSEEHTMNGGELEAVALVSMSGAYSFRCMHAHCTELHTWRGFRNYVETHSTKPKYNWDTKTVLLFGKRIAGAEVSA